MPTYYERVHHMGIKQIVTDDLTGKEVPADTIPTNVMVDGTEYNVYLSVESKETFLALLAGEAPLLADTRPAVARSSRSSKAAATSADKDRNAAVREWAKATGFEYPGADGKARKLGDRGAIPDAVYKAFDAAN